MALKPYYYSAPSAWASYLINGDSSGIDEKEKAAADAFVASVGMGSAVSCEHEGFVKYHDAWDMYPFQAECEMYAFLK